ncbi:hypothetical protein FDP41_012862 [Naegleria fowleri]|uniref:Uncharacterized protein n=1 Tax=Naegleria fowleri TaxID=5763 RepID=A0A6A5C3I7_NAEFO|nr:uncharacterized protein FDP41_012862 [Naegleria fowleri]KAF0981074.1 hypothetical protein FDP41_012862 [Naegleria fowleri]CAG4716502.1 unnamed protein product [Naegleria fowleri]
MSFRQITGTDSLFFQLHHLNKSSSSHNRHIHEDSSLLEHVERFQFALFSNIRTEGLRERDPLVREYELTLERRFQQQQQLNSMYRSSATLSPSLSSNAPCGEEHEDDDDDDHVMLSDEPELEGSEVTLDSVSRGLNFDLNEGYINEEDMMASGVVYGEDDEQAVVYEG